MKHRRRPEQKKEAQSPPPYERHPAHRRLLTALAADRYDWAGAQRRPGSARRRVRDAESALGLYRKWFSEMLRGKFDLGLDMLFHYLEVLGISPADFFGRVFPAPRDPVTELVRRLRAIAGSRYAVLRAEHVGEVRLDDGACAGLRATMEPLDNLQKEDPRLAVKAIRTELEKATDTRMRGHWLALLTVAYKGTLRLDQAAACALVALDLADLTRSDLLRVDALVYGTSLVGDEGEYALCADVMLEALVAAEVAGDADARGRALFRRGLYLVQGGAPAEALHLYRAATPLLATDLWRFAALQAAGVAALHVGDLSLALDRLACASQLPVPRAARGFAWWLHAETAASLGRHAEAATAYAEARRLLDLSHPADWVFVAVQEARALLECGRAPEAAQTLKEAAPVAEVLSDLGPAGAAKLELLTAAAEGAAALDRLERLATRLGATSPLAASDRSVRCRPDQTTGRSR